MPYGKRTYRRSAASTYRKRRTPRKRYSKRRYAKVSNKRSLWKSPLPTRAFYKLRYQDQGYTMSVGSLGLWKAMRAWRGNSLYDPDYSGLGVQPYGYDNYCGGAGTPFGAYRVYASKIKVYLHCLVQDPASVRGVRVVLIPSRVTLPYSSSFSSVDNCPYSKSLCVNTLDSGPKSWTLSNYMSTKKMFGVKNIDESNFQAVYNSNPAEAWYWYVQVDDTIAGSSVAGDPRVWSVDVKITYYCELIRTDDLNSS